MTLGMQLGPSDSESKFQWHIEARRSWRRYTKLNTGEVVNRVTATLNQRQNFVKPALSASNPRCNTGIESQLRKAHNISEIELLEFHVIRNVQEDRIGINGRRRHFEASLPAKPSHPSELPVQQ